MKIKYIKCNKCNDVLFSFHRHDYKQCTCKESFIDGGFDYSRYNGELLIEEIKDVMELVSNQFTWGQNYDENNNKLPETIYRPLKDLTSSHITGIIRYLIDRMTINEEFNIYCIGQQTKAFLIIFTYELENRLKNGKEI